MGERNKNEQQREIEQKPSIAILEGYSINHYENRCLEKKFLSQKCVPLHFKRYFLKVNFVSSTINKKTFEFLFLRMNRMTFNTVF